MREARVRRDVKAGLGECETRRNSSQRDRRVEASEQASSDLDRDHTGEPTVTHPSPAATTRRESSNRGKKLIHPQHTAGLWGKPESWAASPASSFSISDSVAGFLFADTLWLWAEGLQPQLSSVPTLCFRGAATGRGLLREGSGCLEPREPPPGRGGHLLHS